MRYAIRRLYTHEWYKQSSSYILAHFSSFSQLGQQKPEALRWSDIWTCIMIEFHKSLVLNIMYDSFSCAVRYERRVKCSQSDTHHIAFRTPSKYNEFTCAIYSTSGAQRKYKFSPYTLRNGTQMRLRPLSNGTNEHIQLCIIWKMIWTYRYIHTEMNKYELIAKSSAP